MDTIRPIGPEFFVTGQIGIEDVAAIAAKGFKTIVNNRPDGEGGEAQPKSRDLDAEAKRYGLSYVYLPMRGPQADPQIVDELVLALSRSTGPVIGFCRTGTRSSALYQAAKQ